MPSSATSAALVLSVLTANASAFKIPFERRASSSNTIEFTNTPISNSSFSFGDVTTNGDSSDIYVGTVVVDGHRFEVQLDSGSSDLWLATQNVTISGSGYQNTGKDSSITYGDGTVAAGPVLVGEVQFGNFTVSKQAFISAAKTNATTDNDLGLLGMGPPLASEIYQTLKGTSFNGLPILANIFDQDENLPNFYSLELARNDLATTAGGVFTIGDVNPNFTQVLQSPKLDVVMDDFWAVFMTGMTVDGDLITGNNIDPDKYADFGVKQTPPSGSTVILLDSGTSLAQGPKAYVDKMYSSVKGASFNDTVGLWQLPCDGAVNASFVFGSQSFPLNPIDASFIAIVQNNQTFCFGSFSIMDASSFSGFDFILGDSFMRSVVSVFNFGNFTNTSNNVAPAIQLMSTVDITTAFAEFNATNNARVSHALQAVAAQGGNSGSSSHSAESEIKAHIGIIIGVIAGVLAVVIGLVICLRRRRPSRAAIAYSMVTPAAAPGPGGYTTTYPYGGQPATGPYREIPGSQYELPSYPNRA